MPLGMAEEKLLTNAAAYANSWAHLAEELRCLDLRLRLLQKKDSDIATQVGSEAGLSVTATDTGTTSDYVLQANQTDCEFLCDRARLIRYEVVVQDKSLFFQPVANDRSQVLTLNVSNDLLEFYPRLWSYFFFGPPVFRADSDGKQGARSLELIMSWPKTAVLPRKDNMQNEQLLNRLASLKTEFDAGQKRLGELEAEQAYVRETMLRISHSGAPGTGRRNQTRIRAR